MKELKLVAFGPITQMEATMLNPITAALPDPEPVARTNAHAKREHDPLAHHKRPPRHQPPPEEAEPKDDDTTERVGHLDVKA